MTVASTRPTLMQRAKEFLPCAANANLKPEPPKPRRTPKEWFLKYFWAGQITHHEILMKQEPSPMLKWATKNRRILGPLAPLVFVQTFYWLLASKYGFYKWFPLRYEMSFVMMFGAVVGGATAEGSGAIAFPVMTLILHVPPTVARDFAVMIQSIGMNSAAISVHLMGLVIEKHALFFGLIGGFFGSVVALEYLDDMDGALKKMGFVSFFMSFAIALFLLNSEKKRQTFQEIPNFDWKKAIVIMVCGFFGGMFHGIAGSGLDVFIFSIITLLYRVNEKVATPTTVALAGLNSAFCFFWRYGMQNAIEPLSWEYWAVCVPIVCLFGPLGAWFSSFCHRQTLAVFIYILETIALVGAFAIIQPGLELTLICVAIIVVAFFYYLVICYLGRKWYVKENISDDDIEPSSLDYPLSVNNGTRC